MSDDKKDQFENDDIQNEDVEKSEDKKEVDSAKSDTAAQSDVEQQSFSAVPGTGAARPIPYGGEAGQLVHDVGNFAWDANNDALLLRGASYSSVITLPLGTTAADGISFGGVSTLYRTSDGNLYLDTGFRATGYIQSSQHINAVSGYRINNSAPDGAVMQGNGTNFSSGIVIPRSSSSTFNKHFLQQTATNTFSVSNYWLPETVTPGAVWFFHPTGSYVEDVANFTYSNSTNTLTVPNITSSGDIEAANIDSTNGYTVAGAASSGTILIGSGTAYVASTATYPDSVASAGKVIRSSGANAFAASTATYPDTVSTNAVLFGSSSNVIGEIASANNSVLVTSGTGVPTFSTALPTAVTIGGSYLYRVGGNDVSLADGGTGSSLSDPNADSLMYWDDTAGATEWLGVGTDLVIESDEIFVKLTNGAGTTGFILRADGTEFTASTATYPDTVAAGKILRASVSNEIVASTATYPDTITANHLLYGTSSNVIGTDASLTYNGSTLSATNMSTGTLSASVVDAASGIRIGSTAPAGTILRGNGTNYVSSTATYPGTFTATHIPFATSANVLGTNANFNYDGGQLAVPEIVLSGITTGTHFDASTGYRIAGSAPAGKILRANGTNYVASTATFPDTVAGAGQLMRSTGANTWAATTLTFPSTVAADSILYASSSNTVSALGAGSNGEVLVVSGGSPTWGTDIATTVTIGGAYIYRVGGTDVSLADGGTGSSLTDPNDDRILFWDDSAGSVTWLELGSDLTISGTTLSVSLTSGVAADKVTVGVTTVDTTEGEGSILFTGSDAGGNRLDADGAGLMYDFANQRLGVQSSTPTAELDVVGDVKISGITTSDVVNASTGIQVGGSATTGKMLRGNGTNFVATSASYPNASTGASGAVMASNGSGDFIELSTRLPSTVSNTGILFANGANNLTVSTSKLNYDATAKAGDGEFYAFNGRFGNLESSGAARLGQLISTQAYVTLGTVSTVGSILRASNTIGRYSPSTATYPDTATSGRFMRASATNAWSESAYSMPASVSANTLLYANTSTSLNSLATANNSVLVTSATGAPSWSSSLPAGTTIDGSTPYFVSGADVSLADGGTGASLTDPNADSIMFWDDSAGSVDWLGIGSNLEILSNNLNVFDVLESNLLGASNGVAPLDANGKIDISYMPDEVTGGTKYYGTWNASTNTPTITSGIGTQGAYYVVSVAGTTTIDGINDWQVNDWIIFNGTEWQKVDNTESTVFYQFLQDAGVDQNQRGKINFAGSTLTVTDDGANDRTTINVATKVNNFTDNASDGFLIQNGNTITGRTLTGTASRITVTNGTGASGNPVIDVGSNVVVSTGSYADPSWVTSLASSKLTGQVSLAQGGTGSALADPGGDRILFWDDSGSVVGWLGIGSDLEIIGTDLNVVGIQTSTELTGTGNEGEVFTADATGAGVWARSNAIYADTAAVSATTYTVADTVNYVVADTAANVVRVTLPTFETGRIVNIKRMGANDVEIVSTTAIDDVVYDAVNPLNIQSDYSSFHIVGVGTQWHIF